MATFLFHEAGTAPIRLSGRFTAANLNPPLAQPGHEPPVAHPAWLPFKRQPPSGTGRTVYENSSAPTGGELTLPGRLRATEILPLHTLGVWPFLTSNIESNSCASTDRRARFSWIELCY